MEVVAGVRKREGSEQVGSEAKGSSECISVDLGGSSVRVGLGSIEQGITTQVARKVEQRLQAGEVLDFIGEAVLKFTAEVGRPLEVGLGFPGLLGERGEVLSAPNLSASWRGLQPSSEVAARTQMNVAAANDARIATLGEWLFGASLDDSQRDAATMVYLGLGTGVGGGIVVEGRVHGGASGAAGELGHVVVEADGPPCACGSRGCVEAFAGGAVLAANARRLVLGGQAPQLLELLGSEAGSKMIDGKLIVRAAEAGDSALDSLLDGAARALGVLAANLIHVVSPDVIVIGGGLSYMGDRLFVPLWEEVRQRVRLTPLQGLRIEPSELGDRAGMLGGLALAAGERRLGMAVHRSKPGAERS